MTKKKAMAIIAEKKNDTNWFDGTIRETTMYGMLVGRMGFGDAEASIILAGLKLAGAKWADEIKGWDDDV